MSLVSSDQILAELCGTLLYCIGACARMTQFDRLVIWTRRTRYAGRRTGLPEVGPHAQIFRAPL